MSEVFVILDLFFNFLQINKSIPYKISNSNNYFVNLHSNKKKIYIQLPKTKSKNIQIIYPNDSFILSWFKLLDDRIIDIIVDSSNEWFSEKLTKDDIVNLFIPSLKKYKNKYHILNCNLSENIQIFNQDKTAIKTMEKCEEFIPVVHIVGFIFSETTINIEYEIQQIMIIDSQIKIKEDSLDINSLKKIKETLF